MATQIRKGAALCRQQLMESTKMLRKVSEEKEGMGREGKRRKGWEEKAGEGREGRRRKGRKGRV